MDDKEPLAAYHLPLPLLLPFCLADSPDDDFLSEIEFVFAYTHVEEQPTTQQQQGGQGTTPPPQQPQQEDGPSRTVNVSGLNGILLRLKE
jgi:hypothetical protein